MPGARQTSNLASRDSRPVLGGGAGGVGAAAVAGTEGCARRSLIGSSPAATLRAAGASAVGRGHERRGGRSSSSGHCGNWELLAALINRRGLEMEVVGRRLEDAGLQEQPLAVRRRFALRRSSAARPARRARRLRRPRRSPSRKGISSRNPCRLGGHTLAGPAAVGGAAAFAPLRPWRHGRPLRRSLPRRPELGPLLSHPRPSNRAQRADVERSDDDGVILRQGGAPTLVHARPGSGAAGACRPGSSAAALSMPLSDHGRFAPTPCRAAPAPHLPPSADRFPDDKHPPRPHPDRSASSAPDPPVRSRHPPPARPHATTHPEALTAPLRTTTGSAQPPAPSVPRPRLHSTPRPVG
jgi:hypothetical protein